MKHLLVLLVVIFAGYAAWHTSDKKSRGRAVKAITTHGFKLGAIVAVLLALIALATYLPSQPLL